MPTSVGTEDESFGKKKQRVSIVLADKWVELDNTLLLEIKWFGSYRDRIHNFSTSAFSMLLIFCKLFSNFTLLLFEAAVIFEFVPILLLKDDHESSDEEIGGADADAAESRLLQRHSDDAAEYEGEEEEEKNITTEQQIQVVLISNLLIYSDILTRLSTS